MATPRGYTYLSPGLYRSPTGATVNRNNLPKPNTGGTTTPAPTAPTYSTTFQRGSNGLYRDPSGRQYSGETIDAYTKRFNSVASRFANMKQGDAEYNALGQKLQTWGKQFGFDTSKLLGKDWKPYQPSTATPSAPPPPMMQQPAQAPTTEAPPSISATVQNYTSPMTQSLLNAMRAGTNTMSAYEPKNFEGSPLYQFQKQKGMADLEKLMSARGLTGSGAEVQANSDFLANLNATESEKQRQFAEQEANRNQSMMQFIANYDMGDREALRNQLNTDLDRRIGQQQFEAGRGDSRNALMTNFLQNILQMQSDNNIAQLSQAGLGQQSQYQQALMNALAQYTANAYPRSYGGGGGGTPPQAPMGPELDIMNILAQYGNRAGNNDAFNQVYRSIFG